MKDRSSETFQTPNGESSGGYTATAERKYAISSYVITFVGLFCLWILLSGKLDLFHLTMGVVSCLIVTAISKDLLFANAGTRGFFRSGIRFLRYIPWLLYKILMANIHVLILTFHPRLMDLIDPRIFRFQSKLKKDLSLLTFGNSITLTPGTITVYISVNGVFKVHALDQKSREGLPGEMQERIARVFEEE